MTNSVHVSGEHEILGAAIASIIKSEHWRERAASGAVCVRTSTGQSLGLYSPDQRLLEFMPVLHRLNAMILRNEAAPVIFVPSNGLPRRGVTLSRLGRNLLAACQLYGSYQEELGDPQGDEEGWQARYADFRFHPVIEVTLRAVMRWWQRVCKWQDQAELLPSVCEMQAVEAMQEMVGHIRRACRSQSFSNLLKDHETKAGDNFQSACGYVTAMFQRHSRLLILRIDLYFRPGAKGWGYSRAADRAAVNYLRGLRDGRIVDGFRGFLIKRENGICRGTHFHLMVLLDGHEHRSAWFLTQQLGESWVKRVGAESGSYFNCYEMKDRYEFNGLGVVHVTDEEKMIGLRIALWYMSKQDCALMVDAAKKKNFWRSTMPGVHDGRGAPRKDPDAIRTVSRILGGKRSKYPPGMEPKAASSWRWSTSSSTSACSEAPL